ncbi:restriction endonuclease subunit S [Vibrio alginolyticus]|uniref:restriction endonuclease subunit S n=1 Tax=Vibrio harveyi group TaxID=717610 RepID=UPI002659010D|nr:restriction endonuclease subunit S [Vibrio antiquarius]MCE9845034.1 restriction endonuclease subunit S [Vibrio antiquarius]HCM0755552.1 restriction endonuclease subunit S [Vibrio parahaemolyticus]
MSNLNMPLIRFTQYSDSWKLRPLSELIASVDSGWSPQCDDGTASMGEWGVLKTTSIQWTGFEPKQNKKLPNALEPRAKLSLSKNDILVTRAGPNERVGVVSIVNQDYPMLMLSDKIIRLRANAEVDPSYLALNLSLKKSNYQIMRKASGLATSQTNISQGFLLQTKLNVPELPEQQKIATFLSKVDEKIALLTEKKDKLTEYKKGVMQQLFNGKWEEQDGQLTFIPPTLRFKADDGSEFPDWEEKTLGDVSDVRDGTHDSPKYVESGYPLITSKNLCVDGTIDYSNVSLISEEDYLQINRRSKVDIGDILFGMIGTIGNPVIVNMSGFAIKNVALIKQKSITLDNKFLIQYLASSSIAKQFYKLNAGGTQKFIALGVIRNLIVDVPCEEEQAKIANFLSAIDQKIDLTNLELAKAKEWKKGLLQQMFV